MTTTKIIEVKSPTWVRALQIGIGAVAVGLSLAAIIFPVLAVAATFTVAAIILFLFGIEQVVAGVFLYKRSRLAHIGLGILVMILSGLVMAYPLASATLVVFLAGIALLLSGISSIIAGLRAGKSEEEKYGRRSTASRGSRALAIGAGALAVALSITIMVAPMFGIALAGIVIGIALLVYGIRLVGTGISGRKGEEEAVRSTLS
ncbi:MAG TPA: DUF308 domain-containing protein [Nitrososphaeraceae archaeon]|jgi:uncharacterized membrane protein HdeD (DUF308 family)|nr:DUF308 domain-containing protein [Nitrososphaeraceae archaeon]